jgi:hypothetical protein
MRLPAKIVAWVLPWFLTGCWFHKTQKPPEAPVAPKVGTTNASGPQPTPEPPPAMSIPTKPEVSETKLPYQNAKQPPKHKKPAAAPDTQQQPVQQVSNGQPAVNAIGQLSTGEPDGTRQQTESNLNEIERGLNGINRQFDDQEQATAAHIREFLKQAREALKAGDVDGAKTLAAKATVLLQELTH